METKSKTTLTELDKSNMSASTQRPVSSSSTRHSDASKSESSLMKQKPQFIVKKVGSEELFKNPAKQGMAGLTQINEENTADLDELMPVRLTANVNGINKAPVNIFEAEMVNPEKYKEQAKGPAYKDGGIVRHSIIGSTDMFERYQRLQKKKAKENGELDDRDGFGGLKNSKQHNLSSQDGISISFSDRPHTRGTFLSNRYSALAEKKNIRSELHLSKEEIVNEITKIKERQDVSNREQERVTAKRPLSSKLYITKEARNLEKFENRNDYWQRTVSDLSHKIGREDGSSLMVTSGKFREKKELVEILDIIQTDEERFGSKIWYHTLRKSTSKPIVKGASVAALPQTDDVFQTTQIQKQLSSLEFIRKPILVKTPAEANPPVERPASRLDGRYLEDKMIARKHILKEIQPAEVEDMQDLAVKGKNKLKLEAEAILRRAHKKETVQIPKTFHKRKQDNNQEETIVRGQTKSEIIRNGLNVFIK